MALYAVNLLYLAKLSQFRWIQLLKNIPIHYLDQIAHLQMWAEIHTFSWNFYPYGEIQAFLSRYFSWIFSQDDHGMWRNFLYDKMGPLKARGSEMWFEILSVPFFGITLWCLGMNLEL